MQNLLRKPTKNLATENYRNDFLQGKSKEGKTKRAKQRGVDESEH